MPVSIDLGAISSAHLFGLDELKTFSQMMNHQDVENLEHLPNLSSRTKTFPNVLLSDELGTISGVL